MRHLRPSDYRRMPWKDGGGTTTELAIAPAGATLAEPFLWRVSSARVEASGPFSAFPGRTRTLALLEGAGLILDLEGEGRRWLKPSRPPLVFPGEVAAQATLIQGPCVDFGLIHDPTRVSGHLEDRWLESTPWSLVPAPTTLLYAPLGGVHVAPHAVTLGPEEALLLEGESEGLQVTAPEGRARVLVVRLTPLHP